MVTKVPVAVSALRVSGASVSGTTAAAASSSHLWGCAKTDQQLPDGSGLSSATWAAGGGGGCIISGLHARVLPGAGRSASLH